MYDILETYNHALRHQFIIHGQLPLTWSVTYSNRYYCVHIRLV